MSGLTLHWVDAFTERQGSGNPAAVCLLGGPAPAAAMQAVAAELGLSETAFVWSQGRGFSLRWFTPTTEVDLCGHATVAAAHVLRATGRVDGITPVVFSTRSGFLGATFVDGRIRLDLPADPPRPARVPAALARSLPIVGATAGRQDLVVELPDAASVVNATPDLAELEALDHRAVVLSAPGERGSQIDYVLRVFAPRVGIPEDPVTGSAQCLLGPFWAERLGRRCLEAQQLSARGGRLGVEVAEDRVGVSGAAVGVLSGELTGDLGAALTAGGHP